MTCTKLRGVAIFSAAIFFSASAFGDQFYVAPSSNQRARKIYEDMKAQSPPQLTTGETPNDKRQEKFKQCLSLGGLYQQAADMRDYNIPPKETFNRIHDSYEKSGIQNAVIKKAINNVYFDQRMSLLDGASLKDAAFHSCFEPESAWQPLK